MIVLLVRCYTYYVHMGGALGMIAHIQVMISGRKAPYDITDM